MTEMTNRERALAVLRYEEYDRLPVHFRDEIRLSLEAPEITQQFAIECRFRRER